MYVYICRWALLEQHREEGPIQYTGAYWQHRAYLFVMQTLIQVMTGSVPSCYLNQCLSPARRRAITSTLANLINIQGPPSLTCFNFNPSIDKKKVHPLWSVIHTQISTTARSLRMEINFILHFSGHVIIYPYRGLELTYDSKRVPNLNILTFMVISL